MALRLATWNCFRGDPGERLSELASLRPDVVCLQEVAAPQQLIPNSIYRAQTSVQGVLLWAREDLLLTAVAEERANGNRALAFLGAAMGVGLAGVWAQSEPSYTRDVLGSLEAARMALGSVPLIFLGDFNASPPLSRGGAEHAKLVATLEEDGLCSAYHRARQEDFGAESHPTFYWQWKEAQPFHLDYCFVPEEWASLISSVEVGGFAEFSSSDHRPVLVELDVDVAAI